VAVTTSGSAHFCQRSGTCPTFSAWNARLRSLRLHHRRLLMNWLVVIIVGGLVGWIASMLMKSDGQMGIIANVLVGIVGSALGFWIAGMLGLAASGGIMRFLVALAGAVLLILILQALGIFRRTV